uniref:REM-1 domain-containing protein n=1 Tax=Nothoprocta perdicaria TaxID=30464 RepID=A0A8C6ZSQ2_NOTPE
MHTITLQVPERARKLQQVIKSFGPIPRLALPAAPEHSLGGCNPLAETGRSKLQNQRAVLNQQILKAVRLRAGAENLLRYVATTNNKVREQVLLELSFVNSDLQILKEELEGLNISVEVYQNTETSFRNIIAKMVLNMKMK